MTGFANEWDCGFHESRQSLSANSLADQEHKGIRKMPEQSTTYLFFIDTSPALRSTHLAQLECAAWV